VSFRQPLARRGNVARRTERLAEHHAESTRPYSLDRDQSSSAQAKPGDDGALGLLNMKPVDHAEVVVRFKTLSAEGDQAAGVVFHYIDPSNYYVMVASAKEESCTLYRVREGKKKKIDFKDVIVSPMTWHELRVIFAQDKYTVLLDGDLALGATIPASRLPA